jgi:hypothetical protein
LCAGCENIESSLAATTPKRGARGREFVLGGDDSGREKVRDDLHCADVEADDEHPESHCSLLDLTTTAGGSQSRSLAGVGPATADFATMTVSNPDSGAAGSEQESELDTPAVVNSAPVKLGSVELRS